MTSGKIIWDIMRPVVDSDTVRFVTHRSFTKIKEARAYLDGVRDGILYQSQDRSAYERQTDPECDDTWHMRSRVTD